MTRKTSATPPNEERQPVEFLRTKLHRPPVTDELVCRERLHGILEHGLQTPLILVSAPAGYGKSALVSHWAASLREPCAWLSLDAGDSDLKVFVDYVLAAVRTCFPDACTETATLNKALNPVPVHVLGGCLINELDAIDKSFVLALDDYHRIEPSSDVHELLRFLLEHPPRGARLVLMTRSDPPLPVVSLRADGRITEVRLRDLRFTAPEISDCLDRWFESTLSAEALANLERHTEGWAVGLRLVSLQLRHEDDPDAFLRSLRGGIHHTQQYLIQEVLDRQSPAARSWILETSIFDRFCTELCEAVCTGGDIAKRSDSDERELVDWVQGGELFVIPLDAQGKWFRYHHLFQSLLYEQLQLRTSPEELARLHVQASEWFETEDLFDEALRHALAAPDVERAAQIVERHARPVIKEDKWFVLDRWISKLPEEVVQDRPELLLGQAWRHYYRVEVTAIPPVLDRIDDLMGGDPTTHALSGEVSLFRGFCSFFANEGAQSLKYLEHALERIPTADAGFRAETEILFGMAGQMEGQKARVTRVLRKALEGPAPLDPLRESRLLLTLMFVYYMSGDLDGAERQLPRCRRAAESGGLNNALAWCDYLEGLYQLQRGRLEAAIRLLEEAGKRKYFHFTRAAADAFVALVLAYEAHGQPEQAAATVRALDEFAGYLGPPFLVLGESCAARLSIMQGRGASTDRWLKASASIPSEVMIWWLEIPCVTRCRALIAEGSVTSLGTAEEILRDYAEMNEAHHNTCHLIEILCLQAIVCEKQRKPEDALAVLERAVVLARPGGFVFPFLELGRPMADLLKRAMKHGDHVREILAAFGARASAPAADARQPVEPLTNREEEILELLEQRLRDKEIADRLCISPGTVKSHLKNLYQKLGVGGRRAAVTKARRLGLLVSR
jgi:LuxR family maltose regulon positive regulatory protein